MSSLEQVWGSVLALPEADRQSLAKRLALLTGVQTDAPADLGGEVHHILVELLRDFPPRAVIVKSRFASRWATGVEALGRFISKAGIPSTGPSRRSILRTILKATLSHLRAHDIPIGPATVGDAFKRIWVVVDDAFPGYAESGLLRTLGKVK